MTVETAPWQPALFDAAPAPPDPASACPPPATGRTPSRVCDGRQLSRLDALLARLRRATDPLDQARLAGELQDLAGVVVADCIRAANRAGRPWRQLGDQLGLPFQTLYRRYGATAPGDREA